MAKLTAAELKSLPASQFGLPGVKKFPMPDEIHVTKAIQFFRYVKPEERKELAANINRRAKELGMKVKVQPSSPFYKYCAPGIKAGMKEGAIIQEFHIGQLSPIVPLEPEVIQINQSVTKNGGPLERLRKLWDSKKTLDEKNQDSFRILQEVLEKTPGITTNLEIAFQGILEANYMLTSRSDFEEIHHPTLAEWLHMNNLKMRVYDADAKLYAELLQPTVPHTVGQIVTMLQQIRSLPVLSAALCHINYSSAYTEEVKRSVNSFFRSDVIHQGFPAVDTSEIDNGPEQFLKTTFPYQMNFTEDDLAIIQQFMRFVDVDHVRKKIAKLIQMIAKERIARSMPQWDQLKLDVAIQDVWPLCLFHLQESITQFATMGYYMDKEQPKFIFVKDPGSIKFAYPVFNQKEEFIEFFLVTIWDEGRKELLDSIIQFFMTPKGRFPLTWNELTWNKTAHPKLEGTDFTDVYKGLQISSNGNISFLLGIDDSWKEKYHLCEKELQANAKDENWEAYKNSLCFLFGLITLVHKRYEVPNAEEQFGKLDYRDAMATLPKAIHTFVMGIKTISKVDKDFNFVLYFIESEYNDKLHVFQQETETDISSEVSIAYRYIMG